MLLCKYSTFNHAYKIIRISIAEDPIEFQG